MNKQIIISRLKDLILEGEAVKATGKILRSGQKFTNRESFSRWKMSCLEYLAIFKGKQYLDMFKKDVKSRLSPNVERGLGILHSLNDALVRGYIRIEIEEVEKLEVGNYVHEERIKELASLPKDKFDSLRLVKLCEELNKCYKNNCELAVAAMVRTILNHVPPIFKMSNFEEVANNYSWGKGKLKGKSKREVMSDLEDTARNIADIHLHQPIRETESLPSMTQVDFKNQLDVLLEEVVRILKSQAKGKKTA